MEKVSIELFKFKENNNRYGTAIVTNYEELLYHSGT